MLGCTFASPTHRGGGIFVKVKPVNRQMPEVIKVQSKNGKTVLQAIHCPFRNSAFELPGSNRSVLLHQINYS